MESMSSIGLILRILLVLIPLSYEQIGSTKVSYGSDFIFAFLTEFDRPHEFLLFSSALTSPNFKSTNISLQVSSDSSCQSNVYLASATAMANFSASAAIAIDTLNNVSRKAVLINSTNEIIVYGLSIQGGSTGAFLALPSNVLTGNYTIITPPAAKNQRNSVNEIGVVAIESDTFVVILSSAKEAIVNFTLNIGETYEYAANIELSGYKVEANKKVAVMSGNKCASIPETEKDCDHVIEMLPPTENLGKSFILSPLHRNCAPGRHCKSFFKISAAYDETTVVRYGSDNKTEYMHLNSGQWLNINPDSKVVSYLQSTKPIITASFAASKNYTGYRDGDPFFSMVNPIEDYGTEFTVITCLKQFKSRLQYFNIEIETTKISGLKIGTQFATLQSTFTCLNVPISNFSACTYRVPCGDANYTSPMVINLSHIEVGVPFNVLVYGYAHGGSYAYLGGGKKRTDHLKSSTTESISSIALKSTSDPILSTSSQMESTFASTISATSSSASSVLRFSFSQTISYALFLLTITIIELTRPVQN